MAGISIKSIILTIAFALLGGTAAVAATSGGIPYISGSQVETGNVTSDAYPNHGQHVSTVARDKEAIGTKTNPNGKVIENHGQAVREAAHDKDYMTPDGTNGDVSDDISDDVSDSNSEADSASGAAGHGANSQGDDSGSAVASGNSNGNGSTQGHGTGNGGNKKH